MWDFYGMSNYFQLYIYQFFLQFTNNICTSLWAQTYCAPPPLFLLKGDRVSSKSFEGGGCMWTHQIPYNSQPLPPSHKCLDIDLQLCILDVCLIFLITAHLITRLLIDEIHLTSGNCSKIFWTLNCILVPDVKLHVINLILTVHLVLRQYIYIMLILIFWNLSTLIVSWIPIPSHSSFFFFFLIGIHSMQV